MKTILGIILGIYVIAVAFVSTDLNPLLLSETYRNAINAIPTQLHILLILSVIPAGALVQYFLRAELSGKNAR